MSDGMVTCRRCGAVVERRDLQSHGCIRRGGPPPSAPIDPLVAALLNIERRPALLRLHPEVAERNDAIADRLSAVLAAARAVAAAYTAPGLAGRDYDPDDIAARACDLSNALAAADGSR